MSKFEDYALYYAGLGWPVFPVITGEKRPATGHGCKDATTDLDQIRRWWRQNPAFNIGIATSERFFVIDLDEDAAKDKHGLEVWKQHLGAFPLTSISETPRGGRHLFFRQEEGAAKSRVGLYDGVDVRGEGGYVLAPPSVVNGKSYTWIQHPVVFGIAKADAEIGAFLNPPKPEEKKAFTVPIEIPEGSRTATLVQLIGSLRAKGLTDAAIRAAVEQENETRCVPPLSDGELEQTVFPALTRDWTVTAPYAGNILQRVQDDQRQRSQSTAVVNLESIDERDPEWLVDGIIPLRETTMLAGDGGVGKSFAWCALAAAITTGRKPFMLEQRAAGTGKTGDVLFFSAEDSASYVLKKRLRQNGADLSRIFTVDCADERFSDIRFNSAFLERLLAEHRPALCVFDPLQAFLPEGTNMAKRGDMRAALGKLHVFGEKYGTTFLIVLHTNKQQTVSSRSRMSDSADIWDLARSVLIAGKTGEADGGSYLSHEKNNYGPECRTTLFRIEDGRLVVDGYTDKRDRDFMQKSARIQRGTPAVIEAACLINDLLDAADGSKVTPGELKRAAKQNCVSDSAMRSAREKMLAEGALFKHAEGKGRGKGVAISYSRYP